MQKVQIFSEYLKEEELKYFDGLLISLIPPYDERFKTIMIEEYKCMQRPKIVAAIVIDGDLLEDISCDQRELEKNLIQQIIECLKMHSYELEEPTIIGLDDQLKFWIEESFDTELQNWKEIMKI